ncbi:MAG: sigma-70 family RNA polymerase sigma factor [Phycisphaerales bacterium]
MDRKEFEELALEHLDAVYRMAFQLTRHPDEASDLVQETYLKALRVAERFEERGGGIRPWLFKILHNAFYSRVSRAARGPTATEEMRGFASEASAPDEPLPAWDLASFDWEHVDDRLKTAIEGLTPEYRAVLLLWGVEGMKYREIAIVLEVPIGTVMSRLHRARSILARQLGALAEEAGLKPESIESHGSAEGSGS